MEQGVHRAHVVVLVCHGQGHINPMVQFSKRLASRGIKITVATTLSNAKGMQAAASGSITFESIYDDCIDSEGGVARTGGFKGFLDSFEAIGSRNFAQLIRNQQDTEEPVKCLVFEASITWASSLATELGIFQAAFFTQSCAAVASYYLIHCDLTGVTPSAPALSMPRLPELGLRVPDLPSLGSSTGRYPPIIQHILSRFDNIDKANWVLFNSFNDLEVEVIERMSKLWPVRAIGPTLPSVYLDNMIEDDNDYGFNMYMPNADACMKWLSSKDTNSVVYISFGSAASLSADQLTEIAEAIKKSSNSFLWALRPSELSKLPTNFVEETYDKGLMVNWCPQLAVLGHTAVGCFVSHCGWNSTVEAICLGVPVVAMPQFLDQMTNAHFIEHVWQVGVTVKANEKGFTPSDEISACIKEVMQGVDIRKNGASWKKLATEAIDRGGSSDKCISEIIAHLLST